MAPTCTAADATMASATGSRRSAPGEKAMSGTRVTTHAATAYANPCSTSLGLAMSARGAGRPQTLARTRAQAANGATASNGPRSNLGAPSELSLRSSVRTDTHAKPNPMAQAHAAISGRNAEARPARTAASAGRLGISVAHVASAVGTAVSMPLTAYAATGTQSDNARSGTARVQAGAGRVRLTPTPNAAPASTHTTRPRPCARASTAIGSAWARGASTHGHGSGVTPSVLGPSALNRHPTPAATWRAYRTAMSASSTVNPHIQTAGSPPASAPAAAQRRGPLAPASSGPTRSPIRDILPKSTSIAHRVS